MLSLFQLMDLVNNLQTLKTCWEIACSFNSFDFLSFVWIVICRCYLSLYKKYIFIYFGDTEKQVL